MMKNITLRLRLRSKQYKDFVKLNLNLSLNL